jgi:hypothetical protein
MWWESQKDAGLYEDLDARGRIIFKCIRER